MTIQGGRNGALPSTVTPEGWDRPPLCAEGSPGFRTELGALTCCRLSCSLPGGASVSCKLGPRARNTKPASPSWAGPASEDPQAAVHASMALLSPGPGGSSTLQTGQPLTSFLSKMGLNLSYDSLTLPCSQLLDIPTQSLGHIPF